MTAQLLFDGGKVLVRCKHCKGVVHAVTGKRHLQECQAYRRKQKLGQMTFEKNGRRLYAIAIQRFNPVSKEWLPEMHYAHGYDANEARRAFLFSEKHRSRVAIVDAGLAIGMFAADRDGKILLAD